MLLLATSRHLLADHYGSTSTIFEGITSGNLFDVSDVLVVEIIEVSICKVVLIVLEIFQPVLVVWDHLPTALPSFLGHSACIVTICKHEIQFVSVFIVLRKRDSFVNFGCFEELSFEGFDAVLFFVDSIGKGVDSFLVKFFHELLEVGYPLTSEELFDLHLLSEKLSIVSQLKLSQTFTFCWNIWHLEAINSWIFHRLPQLVLEFSISSDLLVSTHKIFDLLGCYRASLLCFSPFPKREILNQLKGRILLVCCIGLAFLNIESFRHTV